MATAKKQVIPVILLLFLCILLALFVGTRTGQWQTGLFYAMLGIFGIVGIFVLSKLKIEKWLR